MKIKHHPDLSSLMSCAAGSQPEALAAVISSHLSMCPECRSEVARMQKIGEALFDNLNPEQVEGALPTPLGAKSQIHDHGSENQDRIIRHDPSRASDIPRPLHGIIGSSLSDITWKWVAPGIWNYSIKLSNDAKGDLRLLKVAPGTVLPDHSHGGCELTLVLQGSYTDHTGTYARGDVADLGDDIEHQPVTCKDEGCICLTAIERPANYKSFTARLLQPILGL